MNRVPKMLASKLNSILDLTLDMKVTAHKFHFNVTGPRFKQYHELFQEVYEELEKAIDDIGEEIRAHAVKVDLSIHRASKLRNYDHWVDFSSKKTMNRVDDLLNTTKFDNIKEKELTEVGYAYILLVANEEIVTSLEDVRLEYANNNAAALEDFVIERIRAHKEHRYMLMSHLK